MPLKWVLHWQPNAGTTVSSQILTEVSQCVDSINGVKEGRWKAILTYYKPMIRDQSLGAELPRDFLGISLPEQPNKYYFIIRNQRIVLEAESSIQTIMESMQSYKSRVALYFEVGYLGHEFVMSIVPEAESLIQTIMESMQSYKSRVVLYFEGFQYQLGDFQLRVGKVVPTHSENLRGIVMEIEYLPISSIDKARSIMEDFVEIWQEAVSKRSLPGHFMHIEPNFSEYGLGDHYTSQHTVVQYAMVMAQVIATVQTVQSGRN